jgi:hypothetical protein
VFVSYHHHGDRWFYNEFSRVFAATYKAVQGNSVEREIDGDDAELHWQALVSNPSALPTYIQATAGQPARLTQNRYPLRWRDG